MQPLTYWFIDWLNVYCFKPFSTVFQLCHGGQCTYSYFPGVLLSSTPLNILFKPLATFTNNHCRNNRQRWERNKSCRKDYHQSPERILTEPKIEPATSCSHVSNTTDWATGLGHWLMENVKEKINGLVGTNEVCVFFFPGFFPLIFLSSRQRKLSCLLLCEKGRCEMQQSSTHISWLLGKTFRYP